MQLELLGNDFGDGKITDVSRINSESIVYFDGSGTFSGRASNEKSFSTTLFEKDKSISVSLPVQRLSTIMQKLWHDHIDILKMGIEGSEYRVIRDIRHIEISQQMLIEFHNKTSKTLQFPMALARLRIRGFWVEAIVDTEYTLIAQ